jgi:hypothetical protein
VSAPIGRDRAAILLRERVVAAPSSVRPFEKEHQMAAKKKAKKKSKKKV